MMMLIDLMMWFFMVLICFGVLVMFYVIRLDMNIQILTLKYQYLQRLNLKIELERQKRILNSFKKEISMGIEREESRKKYNEMRLEYYKKYGEDYDDL